MLFGIQAQGLSKSYNGQPAVDGLALSIPQGRIYGLLGPNGAGKSTTIRMLTGILRPDKGSIRIVGKQMTPDAVETKLLLGVVPDDLGLFEYLSVWEHMDIIREAYRLDRDTFETRCNQLLIALDLASAVHKQVRFCSYGMKKKTALAMALLPNPKVLILDEPFEGLDPAMAQTVEISLRQAAERGLTVLITTHVLLAMNNLIQDYGMMASGRLIAEGSVAELTNQGGSLQEEYLKVFGKEPLTELPWLG